MSRQSHRVDGEGRVDYSQTIRFTFDGKSYPAYAGDTLASALLANGVKLVARSFKYHRPRGVYSAGSEEPTALVTVGEGARVAPNTRATTVELYDGLVARSQNAWPSLSLDFGAINNRLSGLFSAGFYYKTFMWPGVKGWMFFERFIRRAAGMGESARESDPDRFERIEEFCDVLVVGAGPAGLAAALVAGRSGARVIIVDENAVAGGAVARGNADSGDKLADWTQEAIKELAGNANVSLLTRCTAFGYYDDNVVGLIERAFEHVDEVPRGGSRQYHWIVRAKKVVLATGAIERPVLFANNDLPGCMLASAAACYLSEYGVCAGQNIVLATNNNNAYATAFALAAQATVSIVDSRPVVSDELRQKCSELEIQLIEGADVKSALGGKQVQAVDVSGHGKINCDLMLSSGGWIPTIHLHSQAGGRPNFDERWQCFLPGDAREDWVAAGACNGVFSSRGCLEEGSDAGKRVLQELDLVVAETELPDCELIPNEVVAPLARPDGKCFVDLQNDVTIADLEQALTEGYRSAELMKRYTTLGMGTDQGKMSNVNALSLLAAARDEAIPVVGVTTFRPPYTPIPIGAIAGRTKAMHWQPTRYTPLHAWHEKNSAVMYDTGLWKRPAAYLRDGETRAEAAQREARHVRTAVGTIDVSTLGKIEVKGPDSAEFLERLYVNRFQSLKPGKARYGVMLREDGFVADDGTTSCLAEDHYFMTTSTANAHSILSTMEFHLQATWPELKVTLSSVTDQWAAIAVAGPHSRELLQGMLGDVVSADTMPFMGVAEIDFQGQRLRIMRVSFSGELGYEVYVPAGYAESFMEYLYENGAAFDIAPYGIDAMDILRIEKGHATGAEIDGLTTLGDLGMARMARDDRKHIGAAMMMRPGLQDPSRKVLVGIKAKSASQAIGNGSHIVENARLQEPAESLGHVGSSCFSPHLGTHIALALVRGGNDRLGETLYASSPVNGTHVEVEVTSSHFFDSKGERVRA